MLTAIREVRRAKGLTLEEVAQRCDPPTTAQTVGRLETGARTVSVGWLNRIAAALGVEAAELVTLPDRAELPLRALLGPDGARAPAAPAQVRAPQPTAGAVALRVTAGVGDYRAGDELWLEPLAPENYARALNRDVLAPRPGGRYAFGRLVARGDHQIQLLPPAFGARQQVIADPAWIAVAARLVRAL